MTSVLVATWPARGYGYVNYIIWKHINYYKYSGYGFGPIHLDMVMVVSNSHVVDLSFINKVKTRQGKTFVRGSLGVNKRLYQ